MTDVLVPFRFDDIARTRAWQFVRDWYRTYHPGFIIRVGTCELGEEWSKGLALRRAFARSKADTLVVADADVIVSPGALLAAIDALDVAAWSMPHNRVYRLTLRTSMQVYGRTETDVRPLGRHALDRPTHPAPLGGGIVVCTRDAFEVTGGVDPRFLGFGGDDVSFARALRILTGPGELLAEPMWHFWHPRTERRAGNRASEENEALAARYIDAETDRFAMRDLIRETWCVPVS